MDDLSKGIKRIVFIFLLLFFIVISYVAYFDLYTSPKIVNNTDNRRVWATKNEVLRGIIYDKDKNVLAQSTRVNSLTQNRQYVSGAYFAHVLGYASPQYGLTGLEAKYDKYLSQSKQIGTFDYLKQLIATKGNMGSQEEQAKKGDNIITTLDTKVQKQAFDSLGDNRGAVVALNPQTGEVLAMVSKPSYDPNQTALSQSWSTLNSDTTRPLLNRALSGLYPPGSTFKTVTASSALENISGIQNETFNDTGVLQFNSKESLKDYDGEAFGNINFKQAYVHSSNVVFGTIGLNLGNSALKGTAESFYFNKTIPSDGFSISKSQFPTYKSYEKGNIAQSAIGQSGVLATPMQMAMVASTIANNGVMMEPHLVSSVVASDGTTVKTFSQQSLGTIISQNTATTMKDLMRGVVTDGTGTVADISGLSVAGKTGTADHKENGADAVPHSWFIGFAPVDNPKIAVAVLVEDGGQGGIKAANIAAQVLKAYLLN